MLGTSSPESPQSPLGSLFCQRHLGHQLEGCDSLKRKGVSTALDTQYLRNKSYYLVRVFGKSNNDIQLICFIPLIPSMMESLL